MSHTLTEKIPVGILGATGTVGQQYIELLQDHPWFRIAFLSASDRNRGKPYGAAVAGRWRRPAPIPPEVLGLRLGETAGAADACRFVFSALPSRLGEEEAALAAAGLGVLSHSSCHRMAPDVPLLVPEINPHHVDLIAHQRRLRGWRDGFLVAKPNCALQSYLLPLFPLHQIRPLSTVQVTTLQAVSGAGYPGVASLDILGNVLPYIAGEEEKCEQEPLKILGELSQGLCLPLDSLRISAHCNRVPVLNGHLACVSFAFAGAALEMEEILDVWNQFTGLPQRMELPSAPRRPLRYLHETDRPQPLLDMADGMTVSIGRLRPCLALHGRFAALSHNTVRGAAGGGLLTAELLAAAGLLGRSPHELGTSHQVPSPR